MLPDRVSNPGLLTYESGALPIALRGPVWQKENGMVSTLDASIIVRKETILYVKTVLLVTQYNFPHSILDASITGGKKKNDSLHLTFLSLPEIKLYCTFDSSVRE